MENSISTEDIVWNVILMFAFIGVAMVIDSVIDHYATKQDNDDKK